LIGTKGTPGNSQIAGRWGPERRQEMTWLKNRRLLKELREEIYKGVEKRLFHLQSDGGRTRPEPQEEDLLVLSLLGQDLANRSLTRLTVGLIILTLALFLVTLVLFITTLAEIALKIFGG
jgi:hypothetical protein